MAGARGTTQVEGFVDFPVNSPYLRNTGEGGLFVKLVVVEEGEFEDELARCCGVAVTDILSESFVADDQRRQPPELDFTKDVTRKQVEEEQKAWDDYVGYHYPNRHDETIEGHARYLSRPYRASIVMGSTGWSGIGENGRKWFANYHTLTTEGKALYDMVQKLNPGCTLHLLTFLDT